MPSESHESNGPSGNVFVAMSMEAETSYASNGAGVKKVALPIVEVKVYPKGQSNSVQTYALLDNASTSTFCSEKLVRDLGILGEKVESSLTTLEKKSSVTETRAVSLSVEGVDSSVEIELPMVYTVKEIPVREENVAIEGELKQWPHFKGLVLPQADVSQIGLLIGQNLLHMT